MKNRPNGRGLRAAAAAEEGEVESGSEVRGMRIASEQSLSLLPHRATVKYRAETWEAEANEMH